MTDNTRDELQEFDVFARFSGVAHRKVKAKNLKEALLKAEIDVNTYSLNPYMAIETMNGDTHNIEIDECEIEYARYEEDVEVKKEDAIRQ